MTKRNNTVNFGDKMGAMFAPVSEKTEEPNIGILNEISKEQISGERVAKINRAKIVKNARNEVVYDVKELDALAKDISERGIQQPLLLRLRPDGKYVITSGHRRFAANEIAITKYSYDGDYLPCIVRDNITDSVEEREALILDNLQRDKSDYNRMMEIVEMRQCAEERRERGETIVNIRHYLMERLGVSNSEISRFERIHSSLIPDLMSLFREERIATNVAHEIAKLDEAAQRYIFQHWDSSNPSEVLAFPVMTKLAAQYQLSLTEPSLSDSTGRKVRGSAAVKFSSIDEGITGVENCYRTLFAQLRSVEKLSDSKGEKRLLRQINKMYTDLVTLQNEMNLLITKPEKNSGEG